MAVLTDRLDFVIGGEAPRKLEEHFGIRTVNDLLRHYPRKYSDGMTVRGEGEELDLEEGEHVTFVDVITDAKVGEMNAVTRNQQAEAQVPARHPGRPSAQGDCDVLQRRLDDRAELTEGTRMMLSGEVGYFKGTMQLTHPAFLVLESPSGKEIGTKSLKNIADASGATGENCCRRSSAILPDLSARREGAELGHLRMRASGAGRARPGR